MFLVGEAMAALDEALPEAARGGLWRSADDAIPALTSFLQPGDVVTVKGSYGVRRRPRRRRSSSPNRPGPRPDPMLYRLLYPLADQFQAFNLFRYITFRSGGAVVTALLISFLFGRPIIAWLRTKQANGQPIRVDGPPGHLIRKKGTPTMGGFLILLALTVATLLWADLTNPYVWIVLLVTVGFGLIGFFDDYKKLTSNSHRGLAGVDQDRARNRGRRARLHRLRAM